MMKKRKTKLSGANALVRFRGMQVTAVCITARNCLRHYVKYYTLYNHQPQRTQISTVSNALFSFSAHIEHMTSDACVDVDHNRNSELLFNSCIIQGNVQVFFGSKECSDDKN